MTTTPNTSGSRGARALADEPIFNIGAVARMSGLSVAVLRAWERRYGFPQAQRSAGRQRVYSQRTLDQLRWVKARIDQGMQAGQAIRALSHAQSELGALVLDARPSWEPSSSSRVDDPVLQAFANRVAGALMAHDLSGADRILAEALAVLSLEDILLKVIPPALADLGEGWEAGEVTVATEHLASAYIRQRLLLWLAEGSPPRPVPPTVLACAPGDWHEIGLLILGVLLRRRLWPIHYLGPAVPLSDLAAFVRSTQPAAVVVVATIASAAVALGEGSREMPELDSSGRTVFCYGGRAFGQDPSLRDGLPGHYLGDSLEDSVERLDGLLRDITGILT